MNRPLKQVILAKRPSPSLAWLVLFSACLPFGMRAQAPPAARAPASPKDAAPIDLTGYWVSIVTEDWRYRMLTPAKGDYSSVPLNPAGRKLADAWDPAKDEQAGNQCKAYGAPAIMRIPGRVHVSWDNATTLKVETDAGTQARLFHFGSESAKKPDPSWQGYSSALWQPTGGGRTFAPGGPGALRQLEGGEGGSLKVITTSLREGYLRKNGVPYSSNATVTEYYSRADEANGDSWLIVTTVVTDPTYLNVPFLTSTHFKKQADAKGWDPSPCSAR
jgi:hypothetical protein